MSLPKNIADELDRKKATAYAVKSKDGVVIKDVDLTKRVVTGLYNCYNFFDSDADVLLDGCCANSISQRGPQSNAVQKIKHLLFHDWTKLRGKILVLDERTIDINNQKLTGPYFEAKMSDTQMGNDTLINYQEGIYDNHSIGFQYLEGRWIDSEAEDWQKYLSKLINPQDAEAYGMMWLWNEIKFFEGSTVAFGANELTPYLGVKSGNKDALLIKFNERIQILQKQISGGKQSDETLQSFEMQLLQLNQMVNELFHIGPTVKDTLKDEGRTKTDTQKTKVVDWSKIADRLTN